jgi:hypothetical protein
MQYCNGIAVQRQFISQNDKLDAEYDTDYDDCTETEQVNFN